MPLLHFISVITGTSLLLLGAHFLRQGAVDMALALLLLAAAGATRQRWLRPILALVLLVGLGVWLNTTATLVGVRVGLDEPWFRLGLIFGGVVLLNGAALALLAGPAAERWFHRGRSPAWPAVLACLLTVGLLAVSRAKAPFPILLSDRYLPDLSLVQVALHGGYAAWLTDRALDPAVHRRLRPVLWSLFSVVFFGQLALGLLGAEWMLMTGELHFPIPALILGGPLYRGEGFFMLSLCTATLVLVGPAWCSHLCYLGAWDDACARKGPRRGVSAGRWIWLGRGATLLLTVAAALGLRLSGLGWTIAAVAAALFGVAGVGIMLMFSRRRGSMVHCTAFCPLGLVANLAGRISPWRVTLMKDGCTNCGACGRVCRYGALEEADIAQGRPGLSCTLCGDCMAVCRPGVIGYRAMGLPPAVVRGVFLALVMALHATFLAVARI